MGCLNSNQGFNHWFGNIHLSGPCNRKCYFCIGQHMMGLDHYNTLDTWPLLGLKSFVKECARSKVKDINITGTNTDPLLYKHHDRLVSLLRSKLPNVKLGIRTNGIAFKPGIWWLYDKASISICSLDKEINNQMMGGDPPYLDTILACSTNQEIKINIVLGPENIRNGDVFHTLMKLSRLGIKRVNLREPYGQPHVGNPMPVKCFKTNILGMPSYEIFGILVTYWDVHFVEVESVNLYASGHISTAYPITGGYDPVLGHVADQSKFPGGRIQEQWLEYANT